MRRTHKLEHFSFDVACVQCGHPHSHQQAPFACVALHVASRILCGLGLKVNKTDEVPHIDGGGWWEERLLCVITCWHINLRHVFVTKNREG